jgi:hypothetical protein
VRRVTIVAAAVFAGLLLAGCGGGSNKSSTPGLTAEQYAERVVDRFLRPLNTDLGVLTALNKPDIKLYLLSGQKTTIRILESRLGDLSRCTSRLDAIGPPPSEPATLPRIDTKLREACQHYESVAKTLLRGLPELTSGDPARQRKGQRIFASVFEESKAGSLALQDAVSSMQENGAFLKAGVRPGA